MLNKKSIILTGLCLVLALSAAGLGYYIGLKSSHEELGSQEQTKEEDPFSTVDSEKAITDLSNRIARTQAKLDAVKQQSAELDKEIAEVANTESNLAAMNARVEALPEEIEPTVELPADSPSAKVLAQPKSPSGVPVSVLKDYEKETGVSSEEIEELMRRQE